MSAHNPLLDMLLGQDQKIGTPGINPAAPDPRVSAPNKIDNFLTSPGGSLLMNLIAQSGYSTIPQSPGASIGRALLATQQQGQERGKNKLTEDLIRAKIGQLNAPPKPASRGTPLLIKDRVSGESRFEFPAEAVGNAPGVRPSSAAPEVKVIIGEDGLPRYVLAEDALGEQAPTGFKPEIEFTDDALEVSAATYRLTGKIPSGLSRQPGVVANILDRARTQARDQGLDVDQALDVQQEFKANQLGLSALERQRTLVGAFEKTAIKNMDLAVRLGKKVGRSGSPIVNEGLIAFKKNILGDPDTTAFVNAIIASRTEYAKVLSGATGAAGITDSARTEAKELFDSAFNQETLERVVEVARQEMTNRMDSFAEQKKEFTIGKRKVDFGRPETIDDFFKPMSQMTIEEMNAEVEAIKRGE